MCRDPQDPHYIALDCAIIGQLSERDQDYLARNLLAFFNRDYRQVAPFAPGVRLGAAAHRRGGVRAGDSGGLRSIFAKPLTEISFGTS